MSRVLRPPGVQVQDTGVQPDQAGLALGHQLRLEAPVAITRRAQLDRPEVGAQRLRCRAVAHVALSGRAAGRMAEMGGQLRSQRGLDQPPGEL
jgi:hypothetical protein